MSTQQDIYVVGFENRPSMLNKENYVSWSSRLLRYAKSRSNGKLIHNSIINGPYVRRMIPEPGDSNRKVHVNETFHVQTDDELTENELKQIEADDQAIQTILLGLPEDIYAAVDSCETAQEIWLRVQQMMNGLDIEIQEKKAKLFNEWERFTSNDGESIESHYHHFLKLMNDLKRNKHFPEKIANITDPTTAMNMALALMAKAFKLNYSTPTNNNQRISSNPRNRQIAQSGINMGQDRQMQMVVGNGGNKFRQYAGQNVGNLNGYNDVQNVENQTGHCELLLRFGYAFCSLKTVLPVLKLGCVLCQDAVAFCLRRLLAFCFQTYCVLLATLCRGKENGANILKSIDEGPYKMGTVRETLAESTEGAPQFGLERHRVYSDLTSEEKDRYNADIRATNILRQGLPKDIYTLINHYTDANDIWDNVKMLLEGFELTKEDREFAKLINDMRNIKMTMSKLQLNSKFVNNMLPEWGRFVTVVKLNRGLRDSNYDKLYAYLKQHEIHAKENKMILERFSQHTVDPLALLSNVSNPQHYSPSSSASSSTQVPPPLADSRHIARNCTQPKRPQNSDYFKDKMLLMQAQENGVALDAEQLLFLAGRQDNAFDDDVDEQPVQDLALNVDNLFQANDCDAFDLDVDEPPTTQTMFMANLSSAYPVIDEAEPSYDSDILSEVHHHNQYMDDVFAHHEEHVMHDSVQFDHVMNSHTDYTSDSNMISYDQCVLNNEVPVVHNNVSSVPNDVFMMIYNDMCEPSAQSVSNPSQNTVVKNSLTAELATYKEHVKLYEQRAKFELTEREQKINEQLSRVISDRNFKEEKLKKGTTFYKIATNFYHQS
nr:hypothetical protein [Tanacetum cinerariifolium]